MSAQWIIEGEPEFDMFPWDLTRFGHWADKRFIQEKVADQYSNRFAIHFPFEERDAGRETRTRPIYQRQKEMGAVHGLNFGWEHPLWYAGEGVEGKESYGFTRQNWFESVGRECRNLRKNVGVVDVSNFGKYEIKGAGAADWIDRVIANYVPKEIGRSCLTQILGLRGGIAGDFTVTKLGEDHFFMIGTGIGERYHQRYFQLVDLPEETTFETVTDDYCGVNVAGPRSRELLARLTQEDLSNENWRFMRSRKFTIAGVEAIGIRVSFTGDLGWEIYVAEVDQEKLWEALFDMGKDLGVMPVGGRSLGCLRVEKGYGSWSREYSPEYWPQEVGFERLIKTDKPEFLGKAGYMAIMDQPPREKLVCLTIEADNADSSGGEPIFLADGTPVGRVSSGAYGFSVDQSCALAFIKTAHAIAGNEVEVAVLGRPKKAIILERPAFDPNGLRLRA